MTPLQEYQALHDLIFGKTVTAVADTPEKAARQEVRLGDHYQVYHPPTAVASAYQMLRLNQLHDAL